MSEGSPGKSLIRSLRLHLIRPELEQCFDRHRVRVDAVIKTGADSRVFRGTFDRLHVVFKKYDTPNAARIVERACAELRYLADNLPAPFFVNPCIAAAPEQGWIVLGHVPGTRMSLALRRADAAEREAIVSLAGQWLGACIALRSETRKLGSRRFGERLKAVEPGPLDGADRAQAERLLDLLGQRVAGLDDCRTVFAIAHGDFAPVNMHHDGHAVHAVDIQGGYWFPTIRTAARFLVAKDLFEPPPADSDLFLGLNRRETVRFLEAAGLGAMRERPEFDFFVGEQFIGRFLGDYDRNRDNPHMRTRLSNLVATLETTAPTGAGT